MELYEDRILVKPDESEEKTKGGIILPEFSQKREPKGTIVAVGPGKYHEQSGAFIEMQHKIGDYIQYSKFAGDATVLVDDEIEYLMMRSADIVMKLN